MTDVRLLLRRPRREDAADVLAASVSNADMARQGDITTLGDAKRHVTNLLKEGSAREPWAVTRVTA